MRPIHSTLAAFGLMALVVGGIAEARVSAARSPTLTRQVRFVSVSASKIKVVKVGRRVHGNITFAASLGGSPTGSATQACGRVKVYASKFVPPPAGSGGFGHQEVVKQVSATPVDAGDLSKGCKYALLGLPANVALALDANYTPTTAWNPVCNGNISQITTNEVASLMLPSSPVDVSLDMEIDYKTCGNLN